MSLIVASLWVLVWVWYLYVLLQQSFCVLEVGNAGSLRLEGRRHILGVSQGRSDLCSESICQMQAAGL